MGKKRFIFSILPLYFDILDGKQKQDVEQTKNISASSVPVVQAESRTKSNKRRIQPLFVASLSLQENEPPSKKAKEQRCSRIQFLQTSLHKCLFKKLLKQEAFNSFFAVERWL